VGALHLNGTTERHERDACEGCANRDTRIAELEAANRRLAAAVTGASAALDLSRSGA